MKYNYFKNCRVVINAGTEVLKIDGMGAPARETPVQEMAGVNIQRTYNEYAIFMANLDCVKVGDRVRVPGFKVPATVIEGEEELNFKSENSSVWYWTETVEDASTANFCYAYGNGNAYSNYANNAHTYVRPRFIILKSKS